MTEYIVKCGELVAVTGKTFQFPKYIDQTEEIVRCRECIHFDKYCQLFEFHMCCMEEMGFCAWGDRKEQ